MQNNSELTQAIYHELGHLFIAFLFFPEFPFSKLNCNMEHLSEQDRNKGWRAGITFNIFQDQIFESIDASDRFICLCFGGLCAQNLYQYDISKFQMQVEHYIKSPFENMNTDGCQPDYDLAKPYIDNNIKILQKTELVYIIEILKFNFSYLTNPIVWNSIKSFAKIIASKNKMVLTELEIYEIARDIKFDIFLKHNKFDILTSRFPIK